MFAPHGNDTQPPYRSSSPQTQPHHEGLKGGSSSDREAGRMLFVTPRGEGSYLAG